MSPYLVSFTVLLIGFNLFSTSSSYAYDPKDHYTEKNVPEVDEHNHEVPDEDSYAVYSLTVPTLYSDHENKEKKPSNNDEESLTPSYYYESCPEFESIVNQKIRSLKEEDETLIPALLRLHFHDCVVRGCDASIMLNHEGSERDAEASKTLRGFEIINEIKGEVEKKCPRTVSCADILTAAARDATTVSNGEYWTVDYGRKDGFVSHAYEADSLVPTGRENMTYLIERFQSLGLDIDDLVALSGAHTIGRSSCGAIQHWLYNKNYTSSSQYSPSINAKYMDYLQRKCRWASDYVDLDAKSPKDFDNEFYVNLVYRKTGLLTTDRLLYSDPRTGYLVKTLAYSPSNFQQQFKKSMINLGNVQVLTGLHEGEVRANCNFVNSHY